jgi:hypothetical protein
MIVFMLRIKYLTKVPGRINPGSSQFDINKLSPIRLYSTYAIEEASLNKLRRIVREGVKWIRLAKDRV